MNAYKATITSVGAALLLSATAQAATLTVSDSISFSWTESLGSNQLSVAQFDSSLGTLDKVEISVTYTVPEQILQMDNDTDGTATGSYGFGEFGSDAFTKSFDALQAPGFTDPIGLALFSYSTQSTSVNLGPDTGSEGAGTLDIQGEADDIQFTTTTANLGIAKYEVNSVVYAQYIGTGFLTMDLAKQYGITNDVTSTGSGQVRAEQVLTTGTFGMEVVYTYTPVPEASAYAAIFGVMALGFVAVRRRR